MTIPIACLIASSYVINIRKPSLEHIIEYTNCTNDDNIMCKDYTKNRIDICVCYIPFNLTEKFHEKIIGYYELETFDQLRDDYVNSKDDNQLQGVLNLTPSENCEPYRYDENGKPIAPCGRVADTLFNDTFNILQTSSNNYVAYLLSGMLEDHEKTKYRNPENITEANLNFAKPKNWKKSIWEFDTNNSENNGFQNELFIGWMNTGWKRKPRARYTQDLPSGSYILRVGYNYPSSIYDGSRRFILTSFNGDNNGNHLLFKSIWIISLIVILLYLFLCLAIYVKYKIQRRKRQDDTNEPNNENTTSLM